MVSVVYFELNDNYIHAKIVNRYTNLVIEDQIIIDRTILEIDFSIEEKETIQDKFCYILSKMLDVDESLQLMMGTEINFYDNTNKSFITKLSKQSIEKLKKHHIKY